MALTFSLYCRSGYVERLGIFHSSVSSIPACLFYHLKLMIQIPLHTTSLPTVMRKCLLSNLNNRTIPRSPEF